MVYSYDIFDTCLLRKCGTPENFFDVLSWKVFRELPTESERQEFIHFRLESEAELNNTGNATLTKIYENLQYRNLKLKDYHTLYQLELECEKEMLVPIISIKDELDCHHQEGDRIIFISDMYLPTDFLQERLSEFGLYEDGDGLYVSGDIGKSKVTGELYKYISNIESIKYKDWTHCGDNLMADIQVPSKLGIRTKKVNYNFSYYQTSWIKTDLSTKYKTKCIAAGLSKSILYSNRINSHTHFVVDIIAPFYSSWTYRIFNDAQSKNIKRLYFCARDGYQQYKIAQVIQERLFPKITCHYLYISRQSIKQEDESATLLFFKQVGLACNEKVAIVDTRSQGRTQFILNELFTRNGYSPIYAYYFEVFPCNKIKYTIDYCAEVNKPYAIRNRNIEKMLVFDLEGPLFEIFFSMNSMPRTIGYEIINGASFPIFSKVKEKDDCWIIDGDFWMNVYSQLLLDYINGYIQTGLYRYSDLIFNDIAIYTLNDFLSKPRKEYLEALIPFRCSSIPFISNENIFQLFKSKGRNCIWKEGSLAYILPERIYSLYSMLRNTSLSKSVKKVIRRMTA